MIPFWYFWKLCWKEGKYWFNNQENIEIAKLGTNSQEEEQSDEIENLADDQALSEVS